MKPLIKKIRTASGYYVYDTWTNEILKVDKPIFQLLPDGEPEILHRSRIPNDEQERARSEIESAKQRGYLRDEHPEIRSFPKEALDSDVDEALRSGPDQLILNVTERCNLRCVYCAYSGAYPFNRTHSDKTMSWDVAKAAADWYFSHEKRKKFSIGFYGGEPLVAFPLLRRVVQHVRARVDKRATFSMTTNGTLLCEKVCRFLVEEGVQVTISLDGPPPVHDRYRVDSKGCGTFRSVWEGIQNLYETDRDYFHKNVSFNVVLAPPIELIQIHEFMADHPEIFKSDSIMISPLNPQSSDVMKRLTLKEPQSDMRIQRRRIHESFRGSVIEDTVGPRGFSGAYYAKELASIHQRTMTRMARKTPTHGQCIPGGRKCFVSTEGQLYMCERVAPARPIGSVWSGINRKTVVKLLEEYDEFFEGICHRCWAVRLCRKCFNDVRCENDFSGERLETFCRSTRAGLHQLLTLYCEMREVRDDAFAWAEHIEIG